MKLLKRRALVVLLAVVLLVAGGFVYLQGLWCTPSFRDSMYALVEQRQTSHGDTRLALDDLEDLLGESGLSARWYTRNFANFISLVQFWPETIVEIRDADDRWLMDLYGNEGYTRFRAAPRVPPTALDELEAIEEVLGNSVRRLRIREVREMLDRRSGAG